MNLQQNSGNRVGEIDETLRSFNGLDEIDKIDEVSYMKLHKKKVKLSCILIKLHAKKLRLHMSY